jgi:CelD/BcsL family acetyltransferase involved in cellulose biosynthesis
MPQNGVSLISDFSELEKLEPDWERLWKSDPRATIFGCFSWARASWRAYGSRRSLCVSVVRRNGRVAGILPLAVDGDTLRFLGDPRSDYNDMLCDPGMGPDLLESALGILSETPVPWRHCILSNIPDSSNIIAHLPQIARRKGLLLRLTHEATCPYVDLSSDADLILDGILKKKSLKRHENKLSRLGQLEFRHLDDREEIRKHLPVLFRQHIARRAMEGEKSIFLDSEARVLYECLVDELDPDGELRFSIVEIDRRPIAYHFGFEDRGTLFWYKPSFDVDYWDYSPGEVLIKKLFEYVKENGLKKFDFTVGGEAFKGRFANRVADNYTLHVFKPGPSGSIDRLKLHASTSLRKHPAIFRATRRILSFVRNSARKSQSVFRSHSVLAEAQRLWLLVWHGVGFSRDEVFVFATRGTSPEISGEGLEIKEGTLSDLAYLAEDHGDFLIPARLSRARYLLRQGDRLYTVWKAGELAHIAWTGIRAEISVSSETGDKCRVELKKPSPVIFDCWTPPLMRGQGIFPLVLSALVAHDLPAEIEHWTYCRQENTEAIQDIRTAGFRLRYRLRRVRLFHYIEFNRISTET